MSDPRPIGVFDSGVGGLTVLRELQRQLPHESTIYFADLGHFPYGPRYQAQVRTFALNIIRFLEKLDVKLVVIACNTATAAALNTAREVFDIPIIGVLPKAAPQLVDLVEAGKSDAPETETALREALADILDYHADTLILGCTHYPLLTPLIRKIAGDKMTVVDSAETTAARVKRVLAKNGLDSAEGEPARPQISVTGSPDRFADVARILFGQDLPPITTVPLELVEEVSGREGAA